MSRHRNTLNFSVKFRLYLHPAYEYKYVALINNDILFITGCWRVVVEGLQILQLLSPKYVTSLLIAQSLRFLLYFEYIIISEYLKL